MKPSLGCSIIWITSKHFNTRKKFSKLGPVLFDSPCMALKWPSKIISSNVTETHQLSSIYSNYWIVILVWPWNDLQNNCHQILLLPTNFHHIQQWLNCYPRMALKMTFKILSSTYYPNPPTFINVQQWLNRYPHMTLEWLSNNCIKCYSYLPTFINIQQWLNYFPLMALKLPSN